MNLRPTAFISYSHSDRDFVNKLYLDLRENGIDAWIDQFEINPGDSLIEKIFSEGLAKSKFFLVILSKKSTTSKWVKEELNAAITQKIDGITHIIPIIIEDCEIPMPLRSLLYIDFSKDYSEGLRTLTKTIFNVSEKPPIGNIPEYISRLNHSVGGLSKEASTLGGLLLTKDNDEKGYDAQLSSQEIKEKLSNFLPDEINDAVDELESYGLIKPHRVIGNAPFHFAFIRATYALYLHFKDEGLDYNPENDIKETASAIVAKKEVSGDELREILKIAPGRINRAVDYLEDYGYIEVIRTLGTAPFNFSEAEATFRTKKFVQENS